MAVLATTLRTFLDQADALFAAGRVPAAQRAYEELIEKAQERTDHSIEAIARIMLARCFLQRKDLDGARIELDGAERRVDTSPSESRRRYEAAKGRLAALEGDRGALRDYLQWAELNEVWPSAIDALTLLAAGQGAEERSGWLQKAVEINDEHAPPDVPMGPIHADLATALEELDRLDEALAMWELALAGQRKAGNARPIVAAGWAAGSLALRLDDVPLAQERLLGAVALAESSDDCADLLALALAELAQIHEAAGDVIEARHTLIRAMKLAREQDLARIAPERWDAIRGQAKRLELDA